MTSIIFLILEEKRLRNRIESKNDQFYSEVIDDFLYKLEHLYRNSFSPIGSMSSVSSSSSILSPESVDPVIVEYVQDADGYYQKLSFIDSKHVLSDSTDTYRDDEEKTPTLTEFEMENNLDFEYRKTSTLTAFEIEII